MKREHTRKVQIGERVIGGGNPILIQSMTNTRTENVAQTVAQIRALEEDRKSTRLNSSHP